ncbi:MAG: NADPH:quinone oxidoreductase family protein [Rhodospirillaceae bacterium]|jgi:NADPH2:quinone reductase|nr:NADPH:quinone oxidoreductase family protein [Rhodospirillaceae bacterium]
MRAVVLNEYGSLDNLSLTEFADPVPGPEDIIVDVRATAVNYVDLVIISGKYQFKPDVPFVPGKGPAGIVKSVGSDVTDFAPGDRVVAMAEQGGYAGLTPIHRNNCYHLPDSMSFTDAASMALVYDTAWFSLVERGRFTEGESVLVLGASGGVGLAAVQLVRAMGGHALAGIANPEKADLVRDAGAEAVIDLAADNLRDSLRDQVFAVTDGRGADVVIDPLGDDIFDAALRAVAWRGRMVVIGFAAGRIPSLKANYLLVKNIDVGGLQISDYRRRRPDLTAKCFEQIFALYTEGKISALPTVTHPIDDFRQALQDVQDRKVRGRIVLTQDD